MKALLKNLDNPLRRRVGAKEDLEEEVARLHVAKIGVKLTVLSKDQDDYNGAPVECPYKTDHYRY